MTGAGLRSASVAAVLAVVLPTGGCATPEDEPFASVEAFCAAWAEFEAAGVEQGGVVATLLAAAPEEIDRAVGAYVASLQKDDIDLPAARAAILRYVADNCA